jgi:hypothetical protein
MLEGFPAIPVPPGRLDMPVPLRRVGEGIDHGGHSVLNIVGGDRPGRRAEG